MPQKSPTNLTTPRNRAISIGTDPAGFTGGVDMEGDAARAGHPSAPGLPVGGYKEQDPAFKDAPSATPASPFTLGGGK